MFVPIRDAMCPVSDRSFARKVAAVTLGSALAIAGATIYVLSTSRHTPPTEADLDATTIIIPRQYRDNPQLVGRELCDHVHQEHVACTSRAATACRYDDIEVALLVPDPDPWGTRYRMRCTPTDGTASVQSAGPDRQFDTADDR